ncbi:MAG: transglutaminase-like domain-containing protein [Pseudomonadota bacterium]
MSGHGLAGALLLLFLSFAGSSLIPVDVSASEPSCHLSADHPLIGETRWYGLYFEDRKIGHARSMMTFETSNADIGGRESIALRLAMTLKLEQTEETIEQVRRFDAAPPHPLLDGMFRNADRHITYRQREDGLELAEEGITRIWADVDRHLCDEEDVALHRFLTESQEIGARIETTDIDVAHQLFTKSIHELEAISTRRIMGADHNFQTLHTEASSDHFSYSAKAGFQNGEAVNLFIGPIEFRAESEAIAQAPNQRVDLFAEFEKPLNRPLARLSAIDRLTLKAEVDGETAAIDEVVRDGFAQRVTYLDDRTAIVEIANHPAPSGDVRKEDYLRATSSHPADHPRLKALVEKIRAPLSENADDRVLAQAILSFVTGYIENVPENPYAYHTTSVFDVLDNRTGDCTEYSQLFVTLARAAGLPAREVSGFVYGGDHDNPSLGGHAWVEVMIDGQWIGMDPTWNEVELNRSHVQVRNVLVPSLAFEVVDVVHR